MGPFNTSPETTIMLTGVAYLITSMKMKNKMPLCLGKRFCDLKQDRFIFFTFFYPPSSGIAPCVGTAGRYMTPTLDAALLSSSRACADLGQTSDYYCVNS